MLSFVKYVTRYTVFPERFQRIFNSLTRLLAMTLKIPQKVSRKVSVSASGVPKVDLGQRKKLKISHTCISV